MDDDELFVFAKEIQAPYALVLKTKELGAMTLIFVILRFFVLHPVTFCDGLGVARDTANITRVDVLNLLRTWSRFLFFAESYTTLPLQAVFPL